jgi:acetyl esterase/lipase
MTILKSIVILASLILSLSCSSNTLNTSSQEPTTETPQEEPQNLEAQDIFDVSYGDHQQQAYDIYLPENRTTETTKVILLIHGGSWTAGDKSDMNYFLPILQPQLSEYAIVNMNYVLANETTPAFPNQINDVGAVIEHVKNNASEYHINPTFGVIGLSAGAHIGLQYTYAEDTNQDIKMACSVVGPVIFTDPFYSENPQFQFVNDLVDENAYPEDTNFEEVLSPALQVSQQSLPTIMFYGESDPLVPLSQANAINDALEANNVAHQLTIYEGGHANWSLASYTDLQAKLSTFINDHL